MALVKKGRDCVAAVSTALQYINDGKLEAASKQLVSLKKDGEELTKQTQTLVKRLEPVELHYRKEEEEIMRKIGELGRREEELKGRKRNVEADLVGKRALLQDNTRRLQEAKSNFAQAEAVLRKAKKKRKKAKHKGRWLGGAVGLVVGGPVGAVVGAGAVGAGASAAHKSGVDGARGAVRRAEEDLGRAKVSLEQSERDVSRIQGEIMQLGGEVEQQKRKRLESHVKVDEVRKVIVFLKKAAQFWGLFEDAAKHGVSRTDLLRKIVDKTKEKEDLSLLTYGGTRKVAQTFMEAWECVEAMIGEGAANYTFQMQFQCSHCKQKKTALPYIRGGNLLCCNC